MFRFAIASQYKNETWYDKKKDWENKNQHMKFKGRMDLGLWVFMQESLPQWIVPFTLLVLFCVQSFVRPDPEF